MIQCEIRLASVLWRFQIKSTLHNSLFKMEFFFKLFKKETLEHMLDIWRKDPNGLSRKPSLPPPPVRPLPELVFLQSGEKEPPGLGGRVFLEWVHLGVVMVLRL